MQFFKLMNNVKQNASLRSVLSFQICIYPLHLIVIFPLSMILSSVLVCKKKKRCFDETLTSTQVWKSIYGNLSLILLRTFIFKLIHFAMRRASSLVVDGAFAALMSHPMIRKYAELPVSQGGSTIQTASRNPRHGGVRTRVAIQ